MWYLPKKNTNVTNIDGLVELLPLGHGIIGVVTIWYTYVVTIVTYYQCSGDHQTTIDINEGKQ